MGGGGAIYRLLLRYCVFILGSAKAHNGGTQVPSLLRFTAREATRIRYGNTIAPQRLGYEQQGDMDGWVRHSGRQRCVCMRQRGVRGCIRRIFHR